MTTTTPKTRSLNVRLSPDVYDALQRRAVEEDRTVSGLTRRWISAVLAEDLGVDRRIRSGGDAAPFDGGHR